ncbi:MAG TPA: hypothetical protein VFT66_09520 [Roseiflexaceae bacterium]|nr:hypothetical protein [Roseiflexaceae bacterium]
MANEHLATYLNDHMAGAVSAIELMDSFEAVYAGQAVGRFFAELRADVDADRQELEALMDRLHISQSRPRKVVAWLGEQATQLKLRLDDSTGGSLRLLEGLDFLVAGIEGKRALWIALHAASAEVPELQGMDYERLKQRAVEQRQRAEVVRREAAKVAFSSES